MQTHCDNYVFINGDFAFRTDEDGVMFLRGECKRLVGTDAVLTVSKKNPKERTFPLGCTGAWLRQQENVLSLQGSDGKLLDAAITD